MSTVFPTNLDNFTNPTGADTLDKPAVLHSTQHANANDAIEALQARVGVTNSAVTSTHEYKINTLVTQFSELDGEVTTLQGEMTAVEGSISTLQSDVGTLQSDVTGLDGRLDTAETSITSLDGRVTTLEQGGGGGSTAGPYFDFTVQTAPAYVEGRLYYDSDEHTLSFYNDITGTSNQVGTELWKRVRNNTGSTITNGSVVKVSGATGQTATVALADADNTEAHETLGLVTHDILTGDQGWVTIHGTVRGLNTNSYPEGTTLYLSQTPGALTDVMPTYPAHVIAIGLVTYQHATQGKIDVKVEDACHYLRQENLDAHYIADDHTQYALADGTRGTFEVAGAVSAHVSALDPHTQYALSDGTRGTFEVSGAVSAHEGALDPHPQYASTSDITSEVSTHNSDVAAHTAIQTSITSRQALHGFNILAGSPTPINSNTGLRRISLDTGGNVDQTYDVATRTVTLEQSGGVIYYYKGTKVTVSSPITVQHAAGANRYYLYFADATGAVTTSTTPWSLQEHVTIGEVYYDGVSKGCCWDERHNANRDIPNHSYLHNTRGAQWASGGVLSSYTIEGATDAAVQYALTSAAVFDEDIRVNTLAVVAGGPYNAWFKSGGVWTFDNTLTVPYKYGTYIQWNNAGTLEDLQPGEFVNYYLYGCTTLCGINQTIHHVGQTKYGNLADALNEGLHNLDFTGFPSPESVPMYRMTYMADSGSALTGKAELIEVVRLNGDKNFDPDSSVSTRSPDNMTMGRVTAAVMRLQNWM